MKKIFLVAAAILSQLAAFAQNADPVIMKINGNDIKRSEFEYSYNKNNSEGVIDKKDVQDYLQLYIDYKLKVEAAKDAGIDTLSNIRTELQGYREQMVYPTIETRFSWKVRLIRLTSTQRNTMGMPTCSSAAIYSCL